MVVEIRPKDYFFGVVHSSNGLVRDIVKTVGESSAKHEISISATICDAVFTLVVISDRIIKKMAEWSEV